MSSTAVHKWLSAYDEPDDSDWIMTEENSSREGNWADSDAWLDTADEHLRRPSDAVVVAISRRRVDAARSCARNLVAGYTGEDTEPELTRALAAGAIADLEDY
jgi:hypothetical protein